MYTLNINSESKRRIQMQVHRLINILSVISIIAALILSGCSESSSPKEEHPLVGEWNLTKITEIYDDHNEIIYPEDQGMSEVLTIRSDNTYTMAITFMGMTISYNGTWSTSDDKIIYTDENQPETRESQYDLNGNTLILTNQETDDSNNTYTEIQEFSR